MTRILFISGTTAGGSGLSQRELATQLIARGHDVLFVVDDKRLARAARWLYEGLSDASVRLARTPAEGLLVRVRDAIQQGTTRTEIAGLPHLTTAYPQNALPRVIRTFQPDIVVANSVERWAWRRIHDICAELHVPTILYVREEASLPHLATGKLPTVLLANTPSLAETLRREGFDCGFIPSVVDVSRIHTTSTRQSALAINPIHIKGGDFVWELAERLPEVPFVLQEAWDLSTAEVKAIEARRATHRHVAFRRRQEPGPGLYADARVLLVPYRVDSRPRVILEAQSNGIPVIAADVPALVEAVGPGGVIIPLSDPDGWVAALRRIWQDDAWYAGLSAAALRHSQRPEVAPAAIAAQFEAAVDGAIRLFTEVSGSGV